MSSSIKANGHEVSARGRMSQAVRDAYDAAL
ncbi:MULTISPECIES: Lsr2 family protein [unclassified Curtobacterium]|nr:MULTISPECIES: Lsr2 family protein [unclassified Curtobacterium]